MGETDPLVFFEKPLEERDPVFVVEDFCPARVFSPPFSLGVDKL